MDGNVPSYKVQPKTPTKTYGIKISHRLQNNHKNQKMQTNIRLMRCHYVREFRTPWAFQIKNCTDIEKDQTEPEESTLFLDQLLGMITLVGTTVPTLSPYQPGGSELLTGLPLRSEGIYCLCGTRVSSLVILIAEVSVVMLLFPIAPLCLTFSRKSARHSALIFSANLFSIRLASLSLCASACCLDLDCWRRLSWFSFCLSAHCSRRFGYDTLK